MMELSVKFSEAQERSLPVEFAETDVMEDAGFGSFQMLKGDPGASAYEIAVSHGYNGSESEWISYLKGRDGIDGKDGKDGKDGADGKPGVDGTPGRDGVDGKTPVSGVDYFTKTDRAEMVAAVKAQLITEQWTFTLMDDTVVTKDVVME